MNTQSPASLARVILRLKSLAWPAGTLRNHDARGTFTQQRWEGSTVVNDYFHSRHIPQFSLYSFYWHYLLAPTHIHTHTHTHTHTDIDSNSVKKQWMTGIGAHPGLSERWTGATVHYCLQTHSASNTNVNVSCDITIHTWLWRSIFHWNTELRLLSESHTM